jgi:hypothetical protein
MTGYNGSVSIENILAVRSIPAGQDRHRVRRLLVHPGLFLSAIRMGTDGNRYTVTGLPDDAEVVDATFDDFTRKIELLVHSASFTPVPPFAITPALDVRITRHEPEAQPEAQPARREPEQAEPDDFATMMTPKNATPAKVVISPDMTLAEIEQARQQVRKIFNVFGAVKIVMQDCAESHQAFRDVIGHTRWHGTMKDVPDGVEMELILQGGVTIPAEPAIDTPIIR